MSHLLNIRCPSCQSKQLSTSEKSSEKLTLTCINCGYVFKATDTDTTPQKLVEQAPQRGNTSMPNKVAASPITHSSSLDQGIMDIAASSGKLNAIKYCKDNTGWPLEQCKNYVDQLSSKGFVNQPAETSITTKPPGSDLLDQQLIEIARTKGKLHAVKFYKDRTGEGLKESLNYVDKVVPPGAFKKTEGCFVATACYGSYEANEVRVLRNYRDQVLLPTSMGRQLVRLYYLVSPRLAAFIGNQPSLKTFIRLYLLQPLVNRLSQNR